MASYLSVSLRSFVTTIFAQVMNSRYKGFIIGSKNRALYRSVDIDVQLTFKRLGLDPINVLLTHRNMGPLIPLSMVSLCYHHCVMIYIVFVYSDAISTRNNVSHYTMVVT